MTNNDQIMTVILVVICHYWSLMTQLYSNNYVHSYTVLKLHSYTVTVTYTVTLYSYSYTVIQLQLYYSYTVTQLYSVIIGSLFVIICHY